jgi:RNA polymerase sigma-70 factor (ECF subfamily)
MVDEKQPETDICKEQRFQAIFRQHYNGLVNHVFYLISDFEQAQEIVQDVFMRVYRNLDSIAEDSQVANYLFIACKNAIKNEYRRRGRIKSGYGRTILVDMEQQEAFFEQKESEEDAYLRNEEQRRIVACLERLKPEDREIIVMKEFTGKRYEEIAEELGTTATVIRGRLHKARQRLKTLFLEMQQEDARGEQMERGKKQ